MAGAVHIGTSGWIYRHWRGVFYPEKLPQRAWFEHYAESFCTVEINNTFYRLPKEGAVEHWRNQAPSGFCYAVKASRFITHIKRLKDDGEAFARFFERVAPLKSRLGPILFQLPPNWKADPERLAEFALHLPRRGVHVFEFRDARWYTDEIREILEKKKLSFCIHDMGGDCPDWVTGKAVYLRFHGSGAKYGGGYPKKQLGDVAKKIRAWRGKGLDVYAYFNNDIGGHAVKDAQTLIGLVGEE